MVQPPNGPVMRNRNSRARKVFRASAILRSDRSDALCLRAHPHRKHRRHRAHGHPLLSPVPVPVPDLLSRRAGRLGQTRRPKKRQTCRFPVKIIATSMRTMMPSGDQLAAP